MKTMLTPPNPFPNSPAEPPVVAPPVIVVRDNLKWEYKRLLRNLAQAEAPAEDELNQLGAEGWELTATIHDSPFIYLYFKRERR